ncbi:cytochrome b-561 [Mytilus galloprovincialis]|uniref:Cytochrome b-561 n=1 Tax=Mytilus galloprovincialis TaxID=29158 RepID=A0A8B6CNU3_MYTGA|nr:cytochrome b-561 [Mytilus galloprovincialis]
MERFDKEPEQGGRMCWFTALVLAVQILGLSAVIIVAVWMGHFRGGFAWQSDPAKEFNFHPVFMVIGMIFLYSDGKCILAYRVFRNMKKLYIKILHGMIHLGALIFSAVGLKAVFDSHNLAKNPIPNMYSLHSWMGIITVVLFGLQWLSGLTSFLFPGLSMGLKKQYMPHHVFWGIAILTMAGATALMGITEKALFMMKTFPENGSKIPVLDYSHKPPEGILMNCLGIVIVTLIALVIYIVTRPEYKREPSPDEEHIELVN